MRSVTHDLDTAWNEDFLGSAKAGQGSPEKNEFLLQTLILMGELGAVKTGHRQT